MRLTRESVLVYAFSEPAQAYITSTHVENVERTADPHVFSATAIFERRSDPYWTVSVYVPGATKRPHTLGFEWSNQYRCLDSPVRVTVTFELFE